MPLPPHIGMPASRAIAASRSASGGSPGSGGSSSYSEENVTTTARPRRRRRHRLLDALVRDAQDREVDRSPGTSAIDG